MVGCHGQNIVHRLVGVNVGLLKLAGIFGGRTKDLSMVEDLEGKARLALFTDRAQRSRMRYSLFLRCRIGP